MTFQTNKTSVDSLNIPELIVRIKNGEIKPSRRGKLSEFRHWFNSLKKEKFTLKGAPKIGDDYTYTLISKLKKSGCIIKLRPSRKKESLYLKIKDVGNEI